MSDLTYWLQAQPEPLQIVGARRTGTFQYWLEGQPVLFDDGAPPPPTHTVVNWKNASFRALLIR